METEYSVKDIQAEMLILLKKFHGLCISNDIKYSVHAGTMIGIIREHGFIEWDDDADVSFTRKEFEKLSALLNKGDLSTLLGKEEDTDYYYSEHDNAFPQLWMKRKDRPAVWIDFFIYDFISENKLAQKVKFAWIAMLLGLLKNKNTMALTRKRGLYSGPKYALIYISYLFGKLLSKKAKIRLAERIRKSMPGKRKLIHRSNDRFIGISFVYPKRVMEEYIVLPFEDTELMVTKRYDDILIPSYGTDYMTPKKDDTAESDVHSFNRSMIPEFGK